MTTTGGCLCGQTRWRYSGPPNWVAHCHCESCRRTCAAPVTTFVGVPRTAFGWDGTAPRTYISSPGVRRLSCGTCGSPVAFDADHYPAEIHLYAAGHDAPEALTPDMHVHAAEALAWLDIHDDLPRAQGSGNAQGVGV